MSEGWIQIRGLEISTHIGVPEAERGNPQQLRVDVAMQPLRRFAEMGDEVAHSLDYHAISLAIAALAAEGERKLVETLANDIADLVLQRFGARVVKVELRKFILPQTEWVGVSLEKSCP